MASEIKVDTVSEKTSGSGVTIDGLLIKDGGISGDVSLIGTTPTFTIGDAGAEDAALVFDGNAQDFYIALDDSADDLVIGLGSAVGTTPMLSFTEGGAATFKNVGTGDDNPMVLTLQTSETDMAANDILGSIRFQAPDEGTGTDAILIAASIDAISEGDFSSSSNATKLSFKTGASEAASEKMSLSSAGLLTIADDLVIKDGGTIGVSSDADSITIASNGAVTFSQTPVFPDGSIAVADLDIDGATDIGANIVDADLFIIDDGAGGTNRKTAASRLKTYIGGAGLVQVARTIVSSDVNDIQLDDCFSSTYNNYLLLIRNVVPANDEVDFMLRLNNGGTQISSSKYCYMNEFLDNGGGSQGSFSGDDNTEFEMAHDVDNESWKGGANFMLHIQTNLGDTSNMSTFTMNGTGSFVADSGIQYSSHFGGSFKDSGRPTATGVDIFFNSGNIARGEISCYGVKIG